MVPPRRNPCVQITPRRGFVLFVVALLASSTYVAQGRKLHWKAASAHAGDEGAAAGGCTSSAANVTRVLSLLTSTSRSRSTDTDDNSNSSAENADEETETGCIGGFGRCCTSRCNGQQSAALILSNCVVTEEATGPRKQWYIDNDPVLGAMAQQQGFQPAYVCVEECFFVFCFCFLCFCFVFVFCFFVFYNI